MRVAYFDCVAGISGDMALGALIDAGADFDEIVAGLSALPIEPFSVEREVVETAGIRAVRVTVKGGTRGVIRTYASIRALLDAAALPDEVRTSAHRIFRRLAEAEAKVHRKEPDLVTFHELGEVESIVGITGTAFALWLLRIERVFASPVPTGLGMVRTEHGAMPVPGPTVVELLRGAPIYSRATPFDLVTPTGAAILATLAEGYGDLPVIRVEAAGYGAGKERLPFPNVLRVLVGEHVDRVVALPVGEQGRSTLRFTVHEPAGGDVEAYHARLLDAAHEAGAEEAWITDARTREGPAWLLTVECPAGLEALVGGAVARLLVSRPPGPGPGPRPDGDGEPAPDHPGLRIVTPPPEHDA